MFECSYFFVQNIELIFGVVVWISHSAGSQPCLQIHLNVSFEFKHDHDAEKVALHE